ncbi:hypothetical protein ACIA8E_36270 [Streptomyces sp. NPDC051664]|uniref:hypothetical protein n=1 Tax=Streptomyces sp. NPDC051664 TaxID=3365668 RepID=UPI0037BD50E5
MHRILESSKVPGQRGAGAWRHEPEGLQGSALCCIRCNKSGSAAEPLLWVADIVAGAVRAEKLGEPRYREILRERVIDFPVEVR